MTEEYKKKKKLQLIEDILKLIFSELHTIDNVVLENLQRVSFTIPAEGSFRWRYEIIWDNDLNFEVFLKRGKATTLMPVRSSTWFKVRDLIRKRYLDAEKLKV